jgi:hypothetical protein
VAKRRNNLSSLLGHLSGPKIDGQNVSKLLTPTELIAAQQGSAEKAVKQPSPGDTHTSAMNAKDVPVGLKFGSPSSKGASTSKSGSEWTSLLTQTASGGVASTLSGGLSSIAGLGGLIAGIASLFGGGGKSTPPPLVEFQLPSSQTQTVYVSSSGSSTYEGNVTGQAPVSTTGRAIYNNRQPSQPSSSSPSSGQSFQYQSTQIAQAVKTALLNSSSLNDVIAEI